MDSKLSLRRRFAGSLVAAGFVGLVVGCSSSSGGGLGNFTGVWKPTAVNLVVTCDGQEVTDSVTDNLTWAVSASDSSDIVSTGSCTVTASVSGDTATATANQTCSTKSTAGATILLTLDTFTFTTADGKNATLTGNGTATVSGINCTFTESGSLSKVANAS